MGDAVKEYSGIAIIVVLFTVLLTAIGYLGYEAREISVDNSNREALRQELRVKRELYSYDNKTLTLDDILLATKKYTKVYSISIQLGGVGSTSWETLTEDDSESKWSIDRLRGLFNDDLGGVYESVLVKDLSGGIVGFKFTRVG